MADVKPGKTGAKVAAPRRVAIDATNLKSAYCNYFAAHENPEEVVLNFGFNERRGSNRRDVRVQLLQQVILHPVTARRVRDVLSAILKNRDSRLLRVKPKPASGEKPN